MRLTYLEVEIGDPANPDITEKMKFLVDSGAIYSVVPKRYWTNWESSPCLPRNSFWPMEQKSPARKASPFTNTIFVSYTARQRVGPSHDVTFIIGARRP
jgi:hypothetical protein